MSKPILNNKATKAYALEVAKGRAHRFTRISKDFLLLMDQTTKQKIKDYIMALPSAGKTI